MKYLITLVVVLVYSNVFAQPLSFYPNLFEFKGKPKSVKQYCIPSNYTENNFDYFLITYNYEKQTRTISYHFKFPKQTEYKKKRELTQSIEKGIFAKRFISNGERPYTRYFEIGHKTHNKNGTVTLTRLYYCDSIVQHVNEDGRVYLEYRYKGGKMVINKIRTYKPDGKMCANHIIGTDGEAIATSVIKYDERNNPILVKGTDRGGNSFTIATEYEYDEYGNFTKSVETEGSKINRTVIREITY